MKIHDLDPENRPPLQESNYHNNTSGQISNINNTVTSISPANINSSVDYNHGISYYTRDNNITGNQLYSTNLPVNTGAAINHNNNRYSFVYPNRAASKYNFTAHKLFPYYSSVYTKSKSQHHHHDSVHINYHHHLPCLNNPAWNNPCYSAILSCSYFYDNFYYYEENANPDTRVKYVSLDGYVIYGNDTLSGIITFDDFSVFLEQPDGRKSKYGNTFSYKDPGMHGLVVFNGFKELHLTHFAGDGGKLWRIIHTGKLNIYDDRFSLLSPGNVDKKNMIVVYGGQARPLNSLLGINVKEQLIIYINKAYNLNLKAKDFTWKSLLTFIDKLD